MSGVKAGADALHSKTRDFNRTERYAPRLTIVFTPRQPNLAKYFKRGCINGFAMVWRTAKIGRLIAIVAVSIAILLLAFGLPVTANGSQNSGQNNPGGYVKYTLDLINNTLINGNFVTTYNALGPWGIAYDPSNGYIYVADVGSGTVSVINGANNSVIAKIPVGTEPWGIAYDPSNGYIYVTNYGSDTVSVINGATNTVMATIPVESGPWGIAYDPSNGYIYVANWGSGTVSVINGANNSVIATIPVGSWPEGVAYDPSNGYIYVTNYGSDTVSVINGATNTVMATIPVGIEPAGVAYDPSNGYIYVTNYGSGTVSVINGATNTVMATIPVGIEPAGVAYDPSNGYIYVTNYGSDTVSIISAPAQAIVTITVTFTESGLPPGTQWSVTFDGLTKSSTSNSITFTGVLPGNYTWNASSIIAVGNGTRYVAQASSGTISVPTELSVSLHYVKQYRVTIQPTAGGNTSPSGTSWYNAGSTIKITAIPAPGYEFVGWETNSSIKFTNSSSATTNAVINSPGTIVALFKAVPSSTQSGTVSVTSTSVPTSSASTKPTPSVAPTLVVVADVVVAVSIAALLMIRLRKP
ncbi:hypothetical protein DDW06_02965 [Sulfolobales archaeon SCGC AB-777_K20]|nr:hypothetical protein DDW06_02965 [Sulfolobales archaeon SCGC AB-777_K20]